MSNNKPDCCNEPMCWVMDNKKIELLKCTHCDNLVIRDKQTGDQKWYTLEKPYNLSLKEAKFQVGDCVKIVRLLDIDPFTSSKLIGLKGEIIEVDELPNGEYNYTLTAGHYMHENELELDIPAGVMKKLRE